ncbi:hypothetical protein TNCT_242821 [Trichonephila clavata]|uniref:Uncharacterized protein n=1 Tax=Trichonephila clavata TaxID=2740835 RepID=A0A8X6LVW9_TRICU|nr:hypothetical protein TNCT_242821 [Trichonephila clavata]
MLFNSGRTLRLHFFLIRTKTPCPFITPLYCDCSFLPDCVWVLAVNLSTERTVKWKHRPSNRLSVYEFR